MRLATLLFFVAILTGCASVSPEYLDPAVANAASDNHAISIERGKHFGLDNVPLVIFLDGKKVAHIGGGQAITLHVKDGRHIVGVAPKPAEENGPNSSVAVDVSAQSQPILRTNVAAWGWAGWKIERVKQ